MASNSSDGHGKTLIQTIDARLSLPWGLFALILAGLIVPSVTQQWASGQKELDVKTNLIGLISSSVARAVLDPQPLAENATPAALDRAQCEQQQKLEERQHRRIRSCQSPREREETFEQASFNAITERWGEASATISSTLAAYYPRAKDANSYPFFATSWDQYATGVAAYIQLGTDICHKERRKQAGILRQIVPSADSRDEKTVFSPTPPYNCGNKSGGWGLNYAAVGAQLLQMRTPFNRKILRNHLAGFTHGSQTSLANSDLAWTGGALAALAAILLVGRIAVMVIARRQSRSGC